MKTVALFSIPGCVGFPGTQVPLHVFEPRYREMVDYCLTNDVMMGVCHTQKVLHKVEEKRSLTDALSSNLSTYKPQNIFSIGHVELLEKYADGRLKIAVDMQDRVELVKEVQTLPFSLVEVVSLPDIDTHDRKIEIQQFKDKIVNRMLALFSDDEAIVNYFQSPTVSEMTAEAFSFIIFSVVRLAPEAQQMVLELRSAEQRLETLLDIINDRPPKFG
jgi:Lon protease-like protein